MVDRFDSTAHLRHEIAGILGPERAAHVEIPFELDREVVAEVDAKYRAAGSDRTRVSRLLDFVFTGLDLRYSLVPTRDAVETFRAREGNCLSFVNLFIGLARHMRLAPFYVEVTDHQRWDQREGLVLSRGHIVAGLYVGGELETYDFLPYEVKAYRDFRPIDDLTATAHYYNNLGAEALLDDDLDRAAHLLAIAASIDPAFTKGINNYGVYLARRGRLDEAVEHYRRGLEVDPEDGPLLMNLARAHQRRGESEEAERVLARVEGLQQASPFYFVYRAESRLAAGDAAGALVHLREALGHSDDVPEVHVALARTYFALGDLEKSRHHLGRALRLDATNADARRLAELMATSGTAG